MDSILASIDAASIVRSLFCMRPRAAALLVEYMHGAADAEPPPELFSEVARAARTKLATHPPRDRATHLKIGTSTRALPSSPSTTRRAR